MSAEDRMADGYEPNFDIDMAVGRQGEMFVAHVADALANGTVRVEVKTDEKAARTGNLYLEYECRSRTGVWAKSGIATTQSQLWVCVIGGDTMIAAPTWRVQNAARQFGKHPQSRKECTRGSNPTRGIVIPLGRFLPALITPVER